jgi:hypothetical protein
MRQSWCLDRSLASLSLLAILRQNVIFSNSSASRSGPDLGRSIAATAEPWTVSSKALAHHRLRNIFCFQVAHPHAPLVRTLTVQLTAQAATEHKGTHGISCLGAARLITLGGCQAVETNRQAAQLDRIAIPHMRHDPSQASSGTTRNFKGRASEERSRPSEQQGAFHFLVSL